MLEEVFFPHFSFFYAASAQEWLLRNDIHSELQTDVKQVDSIKLCGTNAKAEALITNSTATPIENQ